MTAAGSRFSETKLGAGSEEWLSPVICRGDHAPCPLVPWLSVPLWWLLLAPVLAPAVTCGESRGSSAWLLSVASDESRGSAAAPRTSTVHH